MTSTWLTCYSPIWAKVIFSYDAMVSCRHHPLSQSRQSLIATVAGAGCLVLQLFEVHYTMFFLSGHDGMSKLTTSWLAVHECPSIQTFCTSRLLHDGKSKLATSWLAVHECKEFFPAHRSIYISSTYVDLIQFTLPFGFLSRMRTTLVIMDSLVSASRGCTDSVDIDFGDVLSNVQLS